ncbi:MAG: hypothetical protein M3Y74_06995 [Chloroflexota bacterium]|nr:hypothetical protein [Chloroflexota bacterium]
MGRAHLAKYSLAALLAVGAFVALHAIAPSGTVYTVAQVEMGLRQSPHAWIGHTVRVQGHFVLIQNMIVPAAPGRWRFFPPLRKGPTPAPRVPQGLRVVPAGVVTGQAYAVSSTLYRLPVVGVLVPQWEGGFVYAIRLLDQRSCRYHTPSGPCPDAIMLGVSP